MASLKSMGSLDETPQQQAYPEYWEADVILRDGATAHLRPISPQDQELLQQMHSSQSQDSIYLRFFSYKPKLSQRELERFTTVDHRDRVCFVLILGDKLIGVGRYDRTSPRAAEVAFMISDHHQGRGIGSILLEHLAAAARENGINRFTAEVLPENRKMLHVFVEAGYDVSRPFEDGVVVVEFDIDPTEKSLAVMAAREHRAEARSVQDLLTPATVAVIGASAHEEHAGHHAVESILAGGFTGTLYGVGHSPFEREGLTFVPALSEIPDPVDLAVIAVPRIAVVSNALALAQLTEDTALRLDLEPVVVNGSVDTAQGGEAAHHAVLEAAREQLASQDVDSVVLVLMPAQDLDRDELARDVALAARSAGRTTVAVFTGQHGPDSLTASVRTADDAALPCFDSPGTAMHALAQVIDYTTWRSQDQGVVTVPEDFDVEAVESVLDRLREKVTGDELYELSTAERNELLGHAGIRVLESVRFNDPEDGPAAAERLGYPVALKTTDPFLRHRLDLGGVVLNIQDSDQLRAAIETMKRTLAGWNVTDFEVQSMAPTGQTVVLRAAEDPLIGPVLSFGMTGDAVNLLDDWAHRVPPLTDRDITRMVRAPKAARKLFGYQGVPPVDTTGLEQLVNRAAFLKDRFPQIAFLELNPVVLSGPVLTVLSAVVKIGDPGQRTDSARRAMLG